MGSERKQWEELVLFFFFLALEKPTLVCALFTTIRMVTADNIPSMHEQVKFILADLVMLTVEASFSLYLRKQSNWTTTQ